MGQRTSLSSSMVAAFLIHDEHRKDQGNGRHKYQRNVTANTNPPVIPRIISTCFISPLHTTRASIVGICWEPVQLAYRRSGTDAQRRIASRVHGAGRSAVPGGRYS